MTRIISRAAFLLAAFCVAFPAASLVSPDPELGVLPNYDIRLDGPQRDTAAVAGLRSVSGQDGAALFGGGVRHQGEPLPSQELALGLLRQRLGGELVVRFGSVSGVPRALYMRDGSGLSEPSEAGAADVARGFLHRHSALFRLSQDEIDGMRLVKDFATPGTGMRTVMLVQQHSGVDVYKGDVRFAIAADGRVLWVSAGDVLPQLDLEVDAGISAERAVESAARHSEIDLKGAPVARYAQGARRQVYDVPGLSAPVEVRPVVFPTADGGTLAWMVQLVREDGHAAYSVVVDALGGRMLSRVNMMSYATRAGLVFEGPYPDTFTAGGSGVPQSQVSFGYQWPSTVGWVNKAPYQDYTITKGNNVDVTANPERSNRIPFPDTAGGEFPRFYADGGVDQEWFFPFQNAYESSGVIADAFIDQDASVTNLFYLINMWHDYAHALGFDEPAGNFQQDNFTRGGCGNDRVYAWSLYGAMPSSGNPSLNNASFLTRAEDPDNCPPAGLSNGEMRMFLFSGAARDSSYDADVVIHEMNHGVTTRLTGGPFDNCLNSFQGGAMGEGWSDWWPASFFDDPVMGEYVTDNLVSGIRNFAMDQNPRGFAELCSLGGCQVHNDGEIMASTLWDLRSVLGRAVTEQLVMDAYKLLPCGPSFLDERDAILMADQIRYNGQHYCQIWDVFTARDMGFDAATDAEASVQPDDVFTAPVCSGWAHLRFDGFSTDDSAGGNGDGLYAVGELIDLDVVLENREGAAAATGVSVTVTTTTPGVTMVEGTRSYSTIAIGASASPMQPFQFRIEPDFVCGSRIDFEVSISWDPTALRSERFSDEGGWQTGLTLLSEDAESLSWTIGGEAVLDNTQNHTPGGSQSIYMQGCYTGDSEDCQPFPNPAPCNDKCSAITSPRFRVPPEQAVVLSFWARYNLENSWDGLYVEVSTDDGANWTPVETIAFPSTLNDSDFGCGPSGDVPALTGPAGNASIQEWTRFEGALSEYAGEFVTLRIVQHTDGCIYYAGAWVDDIEVAVASCSTTPTVNLIVGDQQLDDGADTGCTDNDGNPDPGETIDWTVTVTNVGEAAASNVMATLSSSNPNVNIQTASQAFGNLGPGASAQAVFRYDVGTNVQCFEPATLSLDISEAGGFSRIEDYDYELRADSTVLSFTDDFDGGNPAWTATLGPDGTAMDWSVEELPACNIPGFFWATQLGIDPANCSTGEPDYSADSDSLLTSPPLDLGAAGHKLLSLGWVNYGVANRLPDGEGFSSIAIDHDGDGVFTTVWQQDGGFVGATSLDLQANPEGVVLLPGDTQQTVQVQLRLRTFSADPGPTPDSTGWMLDDLSLSWQTCDAVACAPGLRLSEDAVDQAGRTLEGGSAAGTLMGQ